MIRKPLTIQEANNDGWILSDVEGEDGEELLVFTELEHLLNELIERYYSSPVGKSCYDYRCSIVDIKEGEYAASIVVTRHKALLELLREVLWLDERTPVIEHATIEDIKGKHVYGVLPHHLSCHAYDVTEVNLDIPVELRGKELTLEQMRLYYKGVSTYKVREVKDE